MVSCLAVELDRAGIGGCDTKESETDVGPAGADQTGEPEHLTSAQLEADVCEGAGAAQAAHLEYRISLVMLGPREEVGRVAAHHLPDQRVLGHIGGDAGRDVPPIAEHRDAIRDRKDLLQAVGDEEDGGPGGLELPHLAEQPIHLVSGQGRRRLVHDQDSGVERNRLGDLHGLLPGDGQTGRRQTGIDMDVESGQDLALRPEPSPAG